MKGLLVLNLRTRIALRHVAAVPCWVGVVMDVHVNTRDLHVGQNTCVIYIYIYAIYIYICIYM